MSLEKKILFIGVPALAIVLGAIFYFLGNAAPANPNSAKGTSGAGSAREYVNSDFKIVLRYPASWQPVAGRDGFNHVPLYFKGDGGFFGIDAIGTDTSGKVSIDDVVKSLISASGNPYGTNPTVTTPDAGNFKARVVTASNDQPLPNDKTGAAALIVQYLKPVKIGADTFSFFMLYGDRAHLPDIAGTLQVML